MSNPVLAETAVETAYGERKYSKKRRFADDLFDNREASLNGELSLEEISVLVGKFKCGRKSNGSQCNCILAHFRDKNGVPDLQEAAAFVSDGRKLSNNCDKEEQRNYLRLEMLRTRVCDSKSGNNVYDKFYKETEVKLCRDCYAFHLGVKTQWVKDFSKHFHSGGEENICMFDTEHMYEDSSFFEDVTYEKAEKVFEHWGAIAAGREFVQMSQVRLSLSYQEAFEWMEEYFSMSESCPVSAKIHLDTGTKKACHVQYVKTRGKNHFSKAFGL